MSSEARAQAGGPAPAFAIDPEKCTECERCMGACALVKTGVVRLADARITIQRRWPEVPGIQVCRFGDCAGQPCIPACPVQAIANRAGYVLIDGTPAPAAGPAWRPAPTRPSAWMTTRGPSSATSAPAGRPACRSA